MAASMTPSPERQDTNSQPVVDRERLQIRIVPYSPPRISSDGSPSSRPVSSIDGSPNTSSQRDPQEPTDETTIGDGKVHCHFENLAGPDINSTPDVKGGGQTHRNWISSTPSPTPSRPPSSRRPTRIISVNSDKTFSLLPQPSPTSLKTESLRSPRRSSTAPSTSVDYSASITLADEPPSSPLTSLAELAHPTSPETSIVHTKSNQFVESSSPWSHRFVGGLRKVAKSIGEQPQTESLGLSMTPESTAEDSLVFNAAPSPALPTSLTSKQSFQSSQSDFSSSDKGNYKTFVFESPGSALYHVDNVGDAQIEDMPRSPNQPNFEVIGESESDLSVSDDLRPRTEDSNSNYVVHRDLLSPAHPTEAGRTLRLNTEYSRESLVVAPLRTGRRVLSDQMFLSKQRSRESIRTGSLTSISSAFIEEATRTLFANSVRVPFGATRHNASRANGSIDASSRNSGSANHKWSTALSTVMSESDRDSVGTSMSLYRSGASDRHSSDNFYDRIVSRPSASADGWTTETGFDFDMLGNQRNYRREANGSNVRLIRDHDEHGDGLAELDELHGRSSRNKLHSFLPNYPSDRNLRSSASSRSDSLSRTHIPAWARLYYGSGERRFLAVQQSSDSLFSEYIASSHHSPAMSRSPSSECFNPEIHHSRRRPFALPNRHGKQLCGASAADEVSYPPLAIVRQLKKQTSSLWSPHLRRDRRVTRYSLWQPPSTAWASRVESPQQNNTQTVLFVLGFIFPLAWMVASVLPLQPASSFGMSQKDYSTSGLDLEKGVTHTTIGVQNTQNSDRARWWRNLNRGMSIFGLLVIGAAVALIVTGTQQRWRS